MNLKKPKFWDYKHRNLLAYLLYPISILIKIISQFKFHPKNEVLKIKGFDTSLGIPHFAAIPLNQIPGDPDSIKGNKVRGVYWTKPDSTGVEVSRDVKIDESKYTEFVKDFEHTYLKEVYNELSKKIILNHNLIINCTPLGTSPNTELCPNIPYQYIDNRHIFYDLIYNPAETVFLYKAKQKGAVIKNGYDMLKLQAEESWRIWNS